jgi:hypothetical protein
VTSLFELDMKIPIPNEVGVCPICGEALVGEVDEYELDDNGDMMIDDGGLQLTCTSEPASIVGCEWEEWESTHETFANDSWHSLTAHVIKWINENYRFTNGHLPQTAEELRHWFV